MPSGLIIWLGILVVWPQISAAIHSLEHVCKKFGSSLKMYLWLHFDFDFDIAVEILSFIQCHLPTHFIHILIPNIIVIYNKWHITLWLRPVICIHFKMTQHASNDEHFADTNWPKNHSTINAWNARNILSNWCRYHPLDIIYLTVCLSVGRSGVCVFVRARVNGESREM